jgi:ABC-2 type transport system ATP-binding protein
VTLCTETAEDDVGLSRQRPLPEVPAAVETHGLVRRYGSVAAVDGIDLSVVRGEIYGFLGPNGAGKSTFIRMLCTLLRPTAGRALVAGYDVVAHPQDVRLRIGVALQSAALDDRQTGRELLELQGRLYGMRQPQIRRRLDEVLDLVDIGSSIDRLIGTYSGGMKRRLDLAAALVHNPEILFLDEPTTGLDPASRESVWSEVRRLNAELSMTIFLTTQYLEEADALAHRIGFITSGRVAAEGTPTKLKRSVGNDLIVAELAPDAALDGVDAPGDARAPVDHRHATPDPNGFDRDGLRRALAELEALDGVDSVVLEGTRLVLSTSDGPGALSPVALTLAREKLEVSSLTLRTSTLDDVFRELTGSPLESRADR